MNSTFTNTKSRITAIAVALVIAFAGMMAMSTQAYAAGEGVYVSGQTVSSKTIGGKRAFVTDKGQALWDNTVAGVRTVELKNATIMTGNKDTTGSFTSYQTAVYVSPNYGTSVTPAVININLTGNNVINASSTAWAIYNACPDVTLNITGNGSLTINGPCNQGIYSKGPINISSNVTILGGYYGITALKTINITGGKLTIPSPKFWGITATGAVGISGGEVSITNFGSCAIQSKQGITITGGKITATRSGNQPYALAAGAGYKISSIPTCWDTINGRLDEGAKFTKNGNIYQVQSNTNYVTLVKYGSTDMTATVSTVTFGNIKYYVTTIGSSAFKGTKIKSITFGSRVKTIKSKAFYGCKYLKTINCKKWGSTPSITVGSKAFTKAYQKPVVKVKKLAKSKVKSKFYKHGLKKATYKTYR